MDKKTNAPQNNFIMHPTNDVCFSGLMENPVVRKGFCAAVLRISPDEILDTELLPTHLHRDYVNDKLGILDVLVRIIYLLRYRTSFPATIGCKLLVAVKR